MTMRPPERSATSFAKWLISSADGTPGESSVPTVSVMAFPSDRAVGPADVALSPAAEHAASSSRAAAVGSARRRQTEMDVAIIFFQPSSVPAGRVSAGTGRR